MVERDAGEEAGDERHALRALVEDVVLDCAVRLVPSAPPPRCAACCDVVAAGGDGWAGAGGAGSRPLRSRLHSSFRQLGAPDDEPALPEKDSSCYFESLKTAEVSGREPSFRSTTTFQHVPTVAVRKSAL